MAAYFAIFESYFLQQADAPHCKFLIHVRVTQPSCPACVLWIAVGDTTDTQTVPKHMARKWHKWNTRNCRDHVRIKEKVMSRLSKLTLTCGCNNKITV